MGVNTMLNTANLCALCVGLDVYKARNRLLRLVPELEAEDIDVTFVESESERFRVLACAYDAKRGKVTLSVSSSNPVRHLPLNYQDNEFLRGFLMLFQHIYNETAITLDNIHRLFRPMDCPSGFLALLADWFGIHLDTLGGEDEIRRFLQYAIPLFRFRGTALGLRIYLAIVSGVVPEIREGVLPYSALEITDTAVTEVNLFETVSDGDCFTVHFPVERSHFTDSLIQRLSLIVRQEKPVHTKCFIGFKQPLFVGRNITVISSDTSMSIDGGISL